MALFPAVFLWKGTLVVPSEEGGPPSVLRDAADAPLDIFDAADFLFGRYHRLYVIDLEGVRYRRPQFEYLQEIARGQEMWVDAGPRNSEEVMDVIVAGASRAVLSTSTLQSAREVSRSLKLTNQLVLSIDWDGHRVIAADPALESASPEQIAQDARERGVADVLFSPRSAAIDWEIVHRLTQGGPAYVGGTFSPLEETHLADSGAAGGVFPAQGVLTAWTTSGS